MLASTSMNGASITEVREGGGVTEPWGNTTMGQGSTGELNQFELFIIDHQDAHMTV